MQAAETDRGDLSLDDLLLDAATTGWHCGFRCQRSSPECIEQPSFLCSCGEYFTAADSSRCPQCGRFAEKVGDETCADCECGPVIETEIHLCRACGEWHPVQENPEPCYRYYREQPDSVASG